MRSFAQASFRHRLSFTTVSASVVYLKGRKNVIKGTRFSRLVPSEIETIIHRKLFGIISLNSEK